MNLPNKLTLFRIILIPFFVFSFYIAHLEDAVQWEYLTFITIANAIFILASVTDFLDGYIARKYNLVTNFGKFADPIADKILVAAALICFVDCGYMPGWMLIVIIGREFVVSGLRLVAVEQGKVIAAGMLGKIKTAVSMIYIIVTMANYPFGRGYRDFYEVSSTLLLWLTFFFTVVSMIEYIIVNRRVLLSDKL